MRPGGFPTRACLTVCAVAQNATPSHTAPAFDAAVVKPNNSGSGRSSIHTRPANVQITNESLRQIIVDAYRIRDYQLSGPDWLGSERFDIDAKAAFGNPESQLMPMMQSRLRERLKLEIHRETKEFPVFGLVPAKAGLTLQTVADKGSSMNSHSDDKGGKLVAESTNMDRLAAWISTRVDRPVRNMTGISGAYSFNLNYTLESDKADADGDTFFYWISAATGLPRSRQTYRVMHGQTLTTPRWIVFQHPAESRSAGRYFRLPPGPLGFRGPARRTPCLDFRTGHPGQSGRKDRPRPGGPRPGL